jgi:hypothetical protein
VRCNSHGALRWLHQAIGEKEQDNALFRFLREPASAAGRFYKWRVWSLSQVGA